MHNDSLIYIADDHLLVAQGLSSLLNELGYTNIRLFVSGKDLYKALLSKKPDLVFLDIYMSDWDGITTLKEIRKVSLHLPCIIVSMMGEKKIVETCLAEKANAFLHKSCDADEVKQALLAIEMKNIFVSEKVISIQKSKKTNSISTYQLTEALSDREREVLEKLCDGLNYEQVASVLYISQNTVETHKKHLLQKFQVNSVSKMIALAYKHKMI